MRYGWRKAVGFKAENGMRHLRADSTGEKKMAHFRHNLPDLSFFGGHLERHDCSVLASVETIKIRMESQRPKGVILLHTQTTNKLFSRKTLKD